ncbi:MAG: DNA-directed RNA polymerase subunit delta [Selenomonadaceae bacterium]|nr:DNA-directed RNA polymerase subunit delta [Selenomonadaceae bacterium]
MDFDYAKSSDVDAAYHILSVAGEPIYYKDLITEVIDKTEKPVQSLSATISEIYTHINMDSRFSFRGEGKWGLTEWNPPETKRSRASTGATAASRANRRKENLFESIQE